MFRTRTRTVTTPTTKNETILLSHMGHTACYPIHIIRSWNIITIIYYTHTHTQPHTHIYLSIYTFSIISTDKLSWIRRIILLWQHFITCNPIHGWCFPVMDVKEGYKYSSAIFSFGCLFILFPSPSPFLRYSHVLVYQRQKSKKPIRQVCQALC